MAIPLLLPLLFAGADPRIVVTGDHQRVEQALSDGVRARVHAGWELVDLRMDHDDYVVTLRKADAIERHVIHFDTRHTYRVEHAPKLPADANEPSEQLLEALRAPRGGFEVTASCGGYYERPYLIDDEAAGEFATSLVARSLATADEVNSGWRTQGRVTFSLRKGTVQRELRVWLDAKGNVIEAQLRRFEDGGGPKYLLLGDLRRAVAKTRVIAIVVHESTFALVTPKGRFVFDPTGSSFDHGEAGDDEDGCGC
jgi:hypothetical protein